MSKRSYFMLLGLLLLISFFAALSYGAVSISVEEMSNALASLFSGQEENTLNERIFLKIRGPRAMMCLVCGAVLGLGGSLLQALFRNPLLDPGLIGTSSGAAFGASIFLVFGAHISASSSSWLLPVFAGAGGLLATALVLALASPAREGRTSSLTLLLTGIAMNAIFMSGVGFLTYLARDPQARSITFWNLGTFSGSSWHSLAATSVALLLCLIIVLRSSKKLNALALGFEEAGYMGVNVKRTQWTILICNTVMVSVCTAFIGVIAFVGLVVPHMVRILFGSDNRVLVPGSMLAGAIMVTCSDLVARLVLQPAELPIGIVTSLVGVPVFILLIRTNRYFFG